MIHFQKARVAKDRTSVYDKATKTNSLKGFLVVLCLDSKVSRSAKSPKNPP
jgi:hypothetical protein